jgi:hypothetical protein
MNNRSIVITHDKKSSPTEKNKMRKLADLDNLYKTTISELSPETQLWYYTGLKNKL